MKQNFFHGLLAAFGLMTFLSSCKSECYLCTIGTYSYQLCENDYSNRDEFEAYVDLLESQGYDCKKD